MSGLPKVGIHIRAFPLPSEAFVTEQARTLRRFEPVFLPRHQLAPVQQCCRPIATGDTGGLKRRLFALAPGAWAWGGAGALKDLSLLHAHFGPNGVYALPIARATGLPLIVTFHGFDATLDRWHLMTEHGLYGLRYAVGLRELKRGGQMFLAVSEFLRCQLLTMGFPEARVRRHYIGVDVARFTPLPKSQRSPDVVCVARLTHAKGIGDLIEAFARIALRHPHTCLRLVGDGPQRDEFKSLAAERGLAHRVVFEGTMSHLSVAEVVRQCAVSVLASRRGVDGWQEAFGLAAIEGAAAGLPVVVTRHGGLPETVEDGVTGCIVGEGRIDQLADALHQLLVDESWGDKLGAAGRERVVRRFNLQSQTAALEDIYLEVLAR